MVCALYVYQGEYDGLSIIRISMRVRWFVHYKYINESTVVCALYEYQGENDGLCIIRISRRVRWFVHYTKIKVPTMV